MADPRETENGVFANDRFKDPSRQFSSDLSPSDRLLLTLARIQSRDTGRISITELAADFHRDPKAVKRLLEGAGVIQEFAFPEVRHDELPEDQRAFFMGLALGDYQVSHLQWSGRNFVAVKTDSRNERKRQLLKRTVGTWGEVRENPRELRIYTESLKFDFMVKPQIRAEFLDTRVRFAPFLLGMMTSRLTDRENRLSLPDEVLLERIHGRFLKHFGFRMGNFHVEPRGENKPVSVIQVKNPGEVFGALIQVNSVISLPFLVDIARISPASK
ncbi:MAG: hypothetical protein A2868_02140 [Candidatus Levybacteria bacterium RIFCSPHIGHO2_01_FULL_40_15b]|nr:MAG: hypothetical protein A2868_02140 [Candidatus Levybacteria bacterium RIFCSPHIGHO2_01_FULL_40_15b]